MVMEGVEVECNLGEEKKEVEVEVEVAAKAGG